MIQLGDENMYWKVGSKDTEYALSVTEDKREASTFEIIPADETDDPYDFSIGWKNETLHDVITEDSNPSSSLSIPKIMRYLEVKTYCWGHDKGPLKFKSNLGIKESRLCLFKPFIDYYDSPTDIDPWLQTTHDPFFISSVNRRSFITISRSSSQANEFKSQCLSSQQLHNEKKYWMLFRLLEVQGLKKHKETKLTRELNDLL